MQRPNHILLTLSMVLGLAGCADHRPQPPQPKADASPENAKPAVTEHRVEAAVERETPVNVVTAPGKIEANPSRISRVMLPVPGRVTEVLAKFGAFVRESQPVAILESPEADAAVAAAIQAEASLNQAKSGFAKADADLDRLRDLYENKAIARKQLLEAENQKTQAQGAVKHAEAALRQAQRRLELLGLAPGEFGQKVTVRAPIAGKVLEVSVAPGEYRNDPNNPLMTIADLSTVWVTADVPESSIRFVQRGERVEIELTAYPGERFPGRVTQIADLVDPQTRTIKVRAELANPGGRLRPEMFGQIRHIDSVRSLPWVPVAAVVQVKGKSVVYVKTASGQYEPREVELQDPVGEFLPVTSGIRAGDRVVVDGALLLRRN
jgi:cobalt-zinc-cadmium efflux system membrane fusion protein